MPDSKSRKLAGAYQSSAQSYQLKQIGITPLTLLTLQQQLLTTPILTVLLIQIM